MVTLAPRISRRVLEAIVRLDDPVEPIAEIYRRVASDAERLGYTRPSYEQIRVLVHRSRRIRKRPTTTDVLLDIQFGRRVPDELFDHLAGVGVRTLPG
jgi:hypothetical protein